MGKDEHELHESKRRVYYFFALMPNCHVELPCSLAFFSPFHYFPLENDLEGNEIIFRNGDISLLLRPKIWK